MFVLIAIAFLIQANARNNHAGWAVIEAVYQDTTKKDSLRYPIQDRRGDPMSNPSRNTFDLKDTSFVKRNVQYDSQTGEYYIEEKIGNRRYRVPVAFDRGDFLRLQGKKDENAYFRKRADMLSELNRRGFKPKFDSTKSWYNRIVGLGKIEIQPRGYVDIMAGYQGQFINNPTLPERARRNGGPDFDMNAQFQVDAKIGDKLRLPINYNTLANMNFENQLNLNYIGKDDEIVKQFQLGNVDFMSKSTLIPGVQSLFGVKTKLQFGKLFVTGVMANQRSNRQSMQMAGGSALQNMSLRADDYEENRHFLLGQYFRNNYNKAMRSLPLVNSNVQIMRVEVWVTNRTGVTTNTRDVIGFMDLGEGDPFSGPPGDANRLPANNVNNLYATLSGGAAYRNSSQAQSALTGLGLTPVQDFEKTFARKLDTTEYYFNRQIGFLSLNQTLQADEVLAVAYQYSYNGQVYQVGEFSQDVPPDSTANSQKVLFLKLLKASSQRTNLPIWDLMMKNVYSVGYGQLSREDFKLDVLYEEPSQGTKRYMPPADVLPDYEGEPLISLLNLDRLNNRNDPQPDGVFDYIEGFTVISSMSRIVFPVLEPFGRDLDYIYAAQAQREKYLYYPLYDTIKAIAQTYANLNRFKIDVRAKSSSVGGDTYQLGFNIPRGSVTVTAGAQVLQENIDYEIDYSMGSLRIINTAVKNSGQPVNIQYENQAMFGLQQKNFMGLRLDYLFNEKLALGGTFVRLGERPFFVKQEVGSDPVRNSMFGLDVDYQSDFPRMTKWLNRLPFYQSNAMSKISAYGEVAMLKPGHAPQIGKGTEGQAYIDDFESTSSAIDLRFPIVSWNFASVPSGNGLFPEASLNNDLASGYNRAKISWYNIEPVLQERNNNNNPLRSHPDFLNEISKPATRQVLQSEIFPQRSTDFGQGLLTTFDLSYFPREKGPYNFEYRNGRIDINGNLVNPRQAWGGIMRNIDQIDFETNNIEYIQFWLMDPFYQNNSHTGGKLYFNLGNISEDVLKDGKRQYENGLPTPTLQTKVDTNTVWGKVPANPMQITNAFSNDPADRAFQDVGFDGLTDEEERAKFGPYLEGLRMVSTELYQKAMEDPANDNFLPYRDAFYDKAGSGIVDRYKNINNPHGNSPVGNNSNFVTAFTQYPDAEELNRDNTLNEVEEYFEYKVDIKPNMFAGSNYITDRRVVNVPNLPNGDSREEIWYLFRIPVNEFSAKVGNIPDFKSIRFIRMYLTDFEDPLVMRFGKLELVRNQWRKFDYRIDTTGNYANLPENDPVNFNTLAVNIEENDQRQPIPYVIPPGIERQQQLSNNNVQLFINEQSLAVQLENLPRNEARGVFKNLNMDMRQYGMMRMFIHAEGRGSDNAITDQSLSAVIRIGSDFQGNYYEVKIPLVKTNWGVRDPMLIWPEANNLDFDLQELTKLKLRRNNAGISPSQYYSETTEEGRSYAIIGNPNLGEVRGMLLSVMNNSTTNANAEVWFNELRFSHLDEKGGYAALGRMDMQLADLGSVSFTGSVRSRGFGTIEQRVQERSREDNVTFDVSASLDLGKLLPKSAGIQIPVYTSVSRVASTPEYDPYDLDVTLKDKLDATANKTDRDSIKSVAQDIMTIKTVNFTNVKKNITNNKAPQLWSISNFDFNYSYIETKQHNPLIELYEMKRTRAALAYNYSPKEKNIEPFKRLIKSKSPWWAIVKDFNVNPLPSTISVRADLFRQFGATRLRNVGGGPYKMPETYDKYFNFDRYYILNWQLFKSFRMEFTATNLARIDEPAGRIDTKEKKEQLKDNVFKGGRSVDYAQRFSATYELPLKKIPALDWTSVRATYTAQYNWLATSLLTRELGNTIGNTQIRNVTADFNFDQLYLKSKFLKAANTPKTNRTPAANTPVRNIPGTNIPATRPGTTAATQQVKQQGDPAILNINVKQPLPDDVWTTLTGKEKRKERRLAKRKIREEIRRVRELNKNILPQVGDAARFGVNLATGLKRITVQYNEEFGTTLPGFMDSSRVMGNNIRSNQPGYGFIFGYQPDSNWINQKGALGLFSRDSMLNAMIRQRYTQDLRITGQIVPVRDLIIDISLDKNFSKDYSELYKDPDGNGLRRLNPYAMGSFRVSYIAFQTMFEKFDPNQLSATFLQFQENRQILSRRLGMKNDYQGGAIDPNDPAYFDGYGRYAQEVVIPSFIAAYTKTNPETVGLFSNTGGKLNSNPFKSIKPKPNWDITFSGLTNIPALQDVFTNVTLRHGYNSHFTMNSFNTALLFQDPFAIGYPYFKDETSGNYIPYFLIPNITIDERFEPLIGADFTTKGNVSGGARYAKSRTLSLSLIDYQLAQNLSTEMAFNFSWRKKGLPFLKNVSIGKKGLKLDNDVTFRMDFSFRDDATSNAKLDQEAAFGTAGQKVIRIAPSIDYIFNNRISFKLFFDQTRSIPKISNAYPITNTRGGLQIRVSLAN